MTTQIEFIINHNIKLTKPHPRIKNFMSIVVVVVVHGPTLQTLFDIQRLMLMFSIQTGNEGFFIIHTSSIVIFFLYTL